MPTQAGANMFSLHANADFHRRAPSMIDRSPKRYQFSDIDWLLEDHLIDGKRNRILLGIAGGARERDTVEEVKKRAAMNLAAEIRHVRRH